MTPEYREAVASWLAKARSDLASARILIKGSEPHLDTGTYHCHQAAEKALKGWLTSRQTEFRKTHDLEELLHQCSALNPSFGAFRDCARFLLPFATQFRCPGDVFEPPMSEALEALECASNIVEFILAELSSAYPQAN